MGEEMLVGAFIQIVVMPLIIGLTLGVGVPMWASWRIRRTHYAKEG